MNNLEVEFYYPDGTRINSGHTYRKLQMRIQREQFRNDKVLERIRKALRECRDE